MATVKDKKTGLVKLKPGARFSLDLLPTIQSLISLGYSESDIGLIIGYSGKSSRELLKGWKKRNIDVRQACDVGRQMANIALVSRAWELAVEGYFYEETEETSKDGKIIETKIKKKHTKPNPGLLQMLLRSRLPEDFKDTRLLKIDKKTLNVDVDGEIENLFGGLINRKKVQSHEVKGTENGTGNETSEDISS